METDSTIDNKPSVILVLDFLLMMEPELLAFTDLHGIAAGAGRSHRQVSRVIGDLDAAGIVKEVPHRPRHIPDGQELVDRDAAEALYLELTGEPFNPKRRPPAAK